MVNITNPDRRALGITMMVLGVFIYWMLSIDFAAIRTNLANPNMELRSAALANVGVTIVTQIAVIIILVLVSFMTVQLHYRSHA